jgi:flagellar basal body P-ring formation protein FlgA
VFQYLFLLILLLSQLVAQTELESIYVTNTKEIKLSDIDENVQNDKIIYNISTTRHTKKVKTKELLHLLKKNGLKTYVAKHSYVKFVQKSPINTNRIKNFVQEYYKKNYPTIKIKKLLITPRSFTTSLPKEYTLHMQRKSFLHRNAILVLKSYEGRETFFDTFITATLEVFSAKKDIKRNEELSSLNTVKTKLFLDKFYALPLMYLPKSSLQAKHSIKKASIISSRDIRSLFLVRRGSNVNVLLDSSNLSISFAAKAIQNGCYGDIIQVINHKGKKIKVMITGKHQARVR